MPTSLLLALALLLASPNQWKVDEPHGPEDLLEGRFEQGTWVSVDVSPDGRLIVFDLLGHLYEMPFAGGEATRLTDGRSWNMFPRYSPDGTQIAFTSDRSGTNALWVTTRNGSFSRQVSDPGTPVFQGTWTADGRGLYGTRLDEKVQLSGWRFGLEGSHEELLPALGRVPVDHFQELPGTAWIYWVQNDGSLPRGGPRVVGLDRETGERVTLVERPGGAASARLSPDGRLLAYVHRDDQDTVLVVLELESGEERVLCAGLDRGRFDSRAFYGCYPNLAWHPDGHELLLSFGGLLHAVPVDGGAVRTIPFVAPVARELAATVRFPVEVLVDGGATTRSHRWARRTARGVLYETLGDLWLRPDEGEPRRLTEGPAHETCPLELSDGRVAFCRWTDEDLGGVWLGDAAAPAGLSAAVRLPGRPSQYGSLAAARDGAGGTLLLALRGSDGLLRGEHLEDQIDFELLAWELPAPSLAGPLPEPRLVTRVAWTGNRYGHRPPALLPEPERGSLLFSEYEDDALQLKRIGLDGRDERTLYVFPDATRAVVSPDRRWIAFREHHRSWLTPFELVGRPLHVSATDGEGFAVRVSEEDGDFMSWSADGATLGWVRGDAFFEKDIDPVLGVTDISRRRTPLAVTYDVAVPAGSLALRGVRVLSMDADGTELDDATVLVQGGRIVGLGTDVVVPPDATVYDLPGRVVMPGMLDAHGHYGSDISALNVIEQRPYGLAANLAYGVTSMVDVYGTTQKDFWLSDMQRAGAIDGPRLFSVGDPIFVTRYRTKMYRPIESLEDALEHARFNQEHGATALKDYSNHGRAARQQLVEASRRLGLNLVSESFADPQMNLTQLVDGFTGLEHTMGLEDVYADVAALFGATQAGMTPTLIVLYNGPAGDGWFHMRERLWEDQKLLRFFRRDELLAYRRPTHYYDDDWSIARMGRALRTLHDAGTLLTMGAHGQMMGLGAHWELELLGMAGFTPREALRMATIEGFTHHGLDRQLGSIEVGKLADLVVLDADPSDDIRNSRSIELVMVGGVLHDGRDGARVWPQARGVGRMYFQRGESAGG